MPDPEKNGAASTLKEEEREKEGSAGKRITWASTRAKAPQRDSSVQKKGDDSAKRSRQSTVPKRKGLSAPAPVENLEALRKRSRIFLDQDASKKVIDERNSQASKGKVSRKENL